ncbi:MAG: hypothetical protein QM709_04700 [Spongiibacteraceae bacterium]
MSISFLHRMTATAVFALMAATIHADTSYPNLEAACANNPERCEQIRAQLAAKCEQDPTACAEKKAKLDQKIADVKAKCAADPEACAQKKEKMQARAAEFKAKCEADPQACEEKKTKLRERLEQRRQNGAD